MSSLRSIYATIKRRVTDAHRRRLFRDWRDERDARRA
ncbi:hypothetical protein EDC65_1687 [Stella humosa]|uniref:Uncharacterized protein n=1 Tax=Stella humosa TaxID=94 RepID=A0A3N1MFC3_9PROT|nr:hypothetical protein EDC65_1687 [Stella humosa]